MPRHHGLHPGCRPVGARARARTGRRTSSRAQAGVASSAASTRRRAHGRCASSFDARLGAPVSPGRDDHSLRALPGGLDLRSRADVPAAARLHPGAGGGGRSTVSARVTPVGPALEFRSRIVIIGPGQVRFAKVACLPSEQLVGAWHATAFRVKQPPTLGASTFVDVTRTVAGRQRGVDGDGHRRAVDRRASGRAGRGGVRTVSFVWPWFLVALLLVPLVFALRACGSTGAVRSTQSRSRTSTCSRRWRRAGAARGGGCRCSCSCSRSRRRRRRSRGRRRRSPCRPTARRSSCWSTSRARCGRTTSSRRVSAPPRPRWTSSPTRCRRA